VAALPGGEPPERKKEVEQNKSEHSN